MTNTIPEPAPHALAIAVPPSMVSVSVTSTQLRTPWVLPLWGKLFPPLALPDLEYTAVATALSASVNADMVSPSVQSLRFVAVAHVKITVSIY